MSATQSVDESTESVDTNPRAELFCSVTTGMDTSEFTDDVVTGGGRSLTGEFQFALLDVSGDGEDELLVKAVGAEISAVKVFGASADGSQLVRTDQIFHDGAASAGGVRTSLQVASDGSSLLQNDGSSFGGSSTGLWTFDGTTMQETTTSESAGTPVAWGGADEVCAGASDGGAEDPDASGPEPTSPGDAGNADTGNQASSGGTLPASATAPSDQIGGTCGTVDDATVKAGDSTSCGFAMAVAQQALLPVYVNDGTGSAGVASVTAASPTNGQTYTMSCSIGSAANQAGCSGGNNAQVTMSKPGNGSMLYLVN